MRTRPLAAALVLAASAGSLPAQCPPERYFVILFGGQQNVLQPRTAHTWATYVRAAPRPDGTVALDRFTISWLPATLNIRPWAVRPEPGVNLDLDQTLAFMSGRLRRVSLWGPYEITGQYYRQAAEQWQALTAGRYTYRVLNPLDLRPGVSHCVHAVTRTDPNFHRGAQPVIWYGEFGTAPVAAALVRSGVVIDPATHHDWLLPALGLDPGEFVLRGHGLWFPILRR